MAFFPLLDPTKPSLLSQLAEGLKDSRKRGIHLLEINQLSKAPEQAEVLVEASKQKDLELLVWIVPALQNNDALFEAETVLEKSGAAFAILYYPPLLEFLALHERTIKTERTFAFPFQKLNWSSLKSIAEAVQKVNAGDRLQLSGEVLSMQTLTQALKKSLDKAKESDRFLWDQFQKMDQNQDGSLTVDEIYMMLSQMGFSKTEVESLVAAADEDNDGVLAYAEFQANLHQDLQKMLAKVDTALESNLIEKEIYQEFLIVQHHFDPLVASETLRWMGETAASVAQQEEPVEKTLLMEWLAANALSFLGVEVLPGKGLFTNRKTFVGNQWTETTQLIYPDGDQLIIERKKESVKVFFDNSISSTTEELIEDQGDHFSYRLTVRNDLLRAIEVEGKWPELPAAMEKILFQTPLKPWQQSVLKEMGSFTLEDPATNAPDRVVCNCMSLCQKDFHPYIKEGIKEVSTLIEKTKATTICGGCEPLVEALCGISSMSVAVLEQKTETENKDIKTLVLKPVEGEVKPFKPGQHIVIQAYFQSQWVTRAYSLISPGNSSKQYEIAVKREELGTLSRWLNDHADSSSIIRISEPKGNYHLEDHQKEIVFFAAGIGVTPALSMLRTLTSSNDSRPLSLDWSAPYEKSFMLKKEFEGYAQNKQFQITYRATKKEGRISKALLEKKYPYTPGKVAFLCGPEAFMESVQMLLKQTNWPDEAIKIEHFNAQVDTEGELLEAAPKEQEHKRSYLSKKQDEAIESDSFFISPVEDIKQEAVVFLKQFYGEKGLSEKALNQRIEEVLTAIETTGTYTHTLDELTFASRVAWRNSTRCVGRYFWGNMIVRDCRDIKDEKAVFETLVEHLRLGINEGNLRAVISIFSHHKPLIRLYNPLLLMFAGYVQEDGSILGDPATVELTKIALDLGWQPKNGKTRFDPLPLVLEIDGNQPKWFEWPEDLIRTIPIEHPEFKRFKDLNLEWFMVPAVAGLALDAGGIQYRCAPSNGFFISTEVGARDLGDVSRYNMLPVIAEKMGLDMSSDETHWKDRAVVELNLAVQWSYRKHKIRMLDHHTIVDYFMKFHGEEMDAGRSVHADWKWIVPPISGSTVEAFHMDMVNKILKPNYFYQEDAWKANDWRTLSKV